MQYLGEFAAVSTAVFWTITSLAFEVASKKVGSLIVNVIRMFLAFIILAVFAYFYRGRFLPTDASSHNWIWLSLSAVIGFVVGDYCLFKSFAIMGSRRAQLFMTLVPPISAITSYFVLTEGMSIFNFLGMALTVGGIAFAIFSRKNANSAKTKMPISGILFAIGGALGQAVGLVVSKYGMQGYNAFAATQIRIITGLVGFVILASILKKWGEVAAATKDKTAVKGIVIGSIFGPFLGVSFSLLAIQNTSAAIASTIMATVPVLIIIPSVLVFKQKVSVSEIIGAIVSVIGVMIFFIK